MQVPGKFIRTLVSQLNELHREKDHVRFTLVASLSQKYVPKNAYAALLVGRNAAQVAYNHLATQARQCMLRCALYMWPR